MRSLQVVGKRIDEDSPEAPPVSPALDWLAVPGRARGAGASGNGRRLNGIAARATDVARSLTLARALLTSPTPTHASRLHRRLRPPARLCSRRGRQAT